MSSGGESSARRAIRLALRVLAGVVAGVTGIAFVLFAFLTLSSLFGPASRDPHGYAMIFGVIMVFPAGLLSAVFVPFAFPPARRPVVARIAMTSFVILCILIVTTWFLA